MKLGKNRNDARQSNNKANIIISLVETILVRIFLPVVAWTNLEDEVSHVLSCHLNGNINPLSGLVSCHDDSSVTPWATSLVRPRIDFPGVAAYSAFPIVHFPLMLFVKRHLRFVHK